MDSGLTVNIVCLSTIIYFVPPRIQGKITDNYWPEPELKAKTGLSQLNKEIKAPCSATFDI